MVENAARIIRLPVRSLVEFVYSAGSIESGFRSASALAEGTRIHQRIQAGYGDGDEKEVYVSGEFDYGGLRFAVDGRCDGLLDSASGGMPTIDEIKSGAGALPQTMEETALVHWAQAYFYAYMIAADRMLERIGVQLTYVHSGSGEERRFVRELETRELERFVKETLERYYPYAKMRADHLTARDASAKRLPFPYPVYREGQRKLAAAVYKTIEGGGGRKLFARAPTGIGKTMSTLFPAVKAIGEGQLQRLFYLTARTTTRASAEAAFALLCAQGLLLHTVTLTAKEKICFKDEVRCSKEHCEYADGYYDRIGEALLDMLGAQSLMTRTVVERYARKHRVCPFEFSLDASYAADAVICDYNYVFDPRINLKRQYEEQKRQTALLVDEAHNLVDRGREMFSAALDKADFLELQRASKGMQPELHRAAKAVNDYFIVLRKQAEAPGSGQGQARSEPPGELLALLEPLIAAAEKELAASGGGNTDSLADIYFACQNFLRIAKLYDGERYVTYIEVSRGGVRIKLFCLDPSQLLRQMGKGYRAQVLFSATLSPLPYYMELLGGDSGEDYAIAVPSPFAADQLDVRIEPLSTRYRDRDRTKERIAAQLLALAQRQPGNMLAFFPSYVYMNEVYERFTALAEDAPGFAARMLVQTAGMTEEEREHFLASFEAGGEEAGALVGFAVMGGIFSEGVDLVGDRLTKVAIVGVGLPQIGPERELLREHYGRQGKNGFDYAYVFPGMNKVLQAGGRLIRSETDRGALLLIDDRYLQRPYYGLLPEEWRDSFAAVRREK